MGIFIAYLLGILSALNSKYHNADRNSYSSNSPCQKTPLDKPISVMCVPPTESDEERAKKEKKERRKTIMFWVEIVSAIILFGYLGVTILIWCANKQAAKAAKEAADTAHDTLIISERPWMSASIELLGPGLIFDPNGSASLNLGVAVKNIGHSVANSIDVRAEMYPMSYDEIGVFKDPIQRESAFCDKFRQEIPRDPRMLGTLFPQDGTMKNITVSMNNADMDSAGMPFNKGNMKYVMPVIYGCVNYGFSFDKLTHQTQFIYVLSWLNPQEPTHRFAIKRISGTVPLSSLLIDRYYFGGALAD